MNMRSGLSARHCIGFATAPGELFSSSPLGSTVAAMETLGAGGVSFSVGRRSIFSFAETGQNT
jgi:hypothetical protein